jgi:hypothetical protein
MINYYQPRLWPYLKLKSNQQPVGLKSVYYHSFEDGLWDLLQNKFSGRKKLTILVPDFYCSNVLDNIKLHGHDYVYYPLDTNFQISASLFSRYLWLNKPDVVIIFNACGISSRLFKDLSWLNDLPEKTIILEDNVHRLVNPADIKLLNNRHTIMDSLRKVTPLPGSRIFGHSAFFNFPPSQSSFFSSYFLKSSIYYSAFRLAFTAGMAFNSSKLVSWSHNRLLKIHDEIIGDSFLPQIGLNFYRPLINRLDYVKVGKLKSRQAQLYIKYLRPVLAKSDFFQVNIPESDFGNLHVYPLGLNRPADILLEKYLLNANIPVWFKFTDSPWSAARSVLFLPLGFHIKDKDISFLAKTILNYSKNVINSSP